MRMVFRYQKPICLIVLVSLYWLCMPQIPAQGAMVTTEDVINQESKANSYRVRIRALLSQKDVIAQLQSYGISSEEALARVNSLTDQEIALIAGKIDQLPAGGTVVFGAGPWLYYVGIAALIIAVIFMIIAYALDEGPSKPTYREF
jgi:hypothetical protein